MNKGAKMGEGYEVVLLVGRFGRSESLRTICLVLLLGGRAKGPKLTDESKAMQISQPCPRKSIKILLSPIQVMKSTPSLKL
jgi:hypothetical protein